MEQKSVVYITATIMVTGLTSDYEILLEEGSKTEECNTTLSEIAVAIREVHTQDIKRNQTAEEVAPVCRGALTARKDRQRVQRWFS